MKIKSIFFLFFIGFQSLFAQGDIPPLNPMNLGADWKEYFDPNSPLLEKRHKDLHHYLSLLKDSLKENSEARGLIEQNLSYFLQLLHFNTQIPTKTAEHFLPAEKYSLNQVLNFNRFVKIQLLELNTHRDELDEKMSDVHAAKLQFDQHSQDYQDLEAYSEQKLLTGLKMMKLQILLKIAEKEIDQLKGVISLQEKEVKEWTNGLKHAIGHMVHSMEHLVHILQEHDLASLQLNHTHEILKAKEAESINHLTHDLEDPLHQLLKQEKMEALIHDSWAKQNYLQAEIKLVLAQLMVNAKKISLDDLSTELLNWKNQFFKTDKKVKDWLKNTQNQLQRSGILLSLQDHEKIDINEISHFAIQALNLAEKNLVEIQQLQDEMEDTQFLLNLLENTISKHMGSQMFLVIELWDLGKQITSQVIDWLNSPLFYIGTTSITLASIIKFFFILLLFYWLSKYLLHLISNYAMQKRGIQHALVYRFSRLFHYLIIGIGLIVALSSIGFDFSSFLLIAGALGVGLGFGLQSIFNNFLSGIIMLFESHFKIGDTIEIPQTDIQGIIKEINFRSTIITNGDGLEVIIPNSELISNKVINWTLQHPFRRMHIIFTVGNHTDPKKLSDLLVEKVKEAPLSLHKEGFPDPMILFRKFSDYGHEYELVVWLNEKGSRNAPLAQSEYLKIINKVFKDNKIEIPNVSRELHVSSLLGETSLEGISLALKKNL